MNALLFAIVNLEALVFLFGLGFLFFSMYGRILTLAIVGLTATTGLL